ncbi:hypothetical protein B0H10DRAFT_1964782 [Mycena sp. CBHHK59/15]|nr:hypothetical protein B0H10DRAFT_1964782 [Mycena sp. CBHHK59/15]
MSVCIAMPAWAHSVFMKVPTNLIVAAKLCSRTRMPEESLNAPLRFQPQPEHVPPTGPVQCKAVGCATRAADAARAQTYRDSCKVHDVRGVAGRPGADVHAPAPQAVAPVQPVEPPRPANAPAPILPPVHGQLGRGRGIPVACGHGGVPAARPRQLAQPMAIPWVKQREVVLREKGPDAKAERQRLEKLEQQSCDFIVYHTSSKPPTQLGYPVPGYPKMQLSSTSLLQALGMTENSWFDLYNHAESSWKTLQATSVFIMDKTRPAIIRIRPSLLVELELRDCPGVQDFFTQQPRTTKRRLDDMVSPPKKLARTNVVDDAAQARTVIVLDSPPPSPTLPSHIPSTSGALVSASTSTASETQAKIWPSGYYIYEHEAAWVKYKRLKDERGRNKVSIHGLWNELFPGSKFVHTTVTLWRGFWNKVPHDVKECCIDEGRKQTGSWQYFVDAVHAPEAEHPLNAPVVKNEPAAAVTSSTGAQSTPHLHVPLPPAPVIPHPTVPDTPVNNQPEHELCVFCDAEITVRPSHKLDQILVNILPLTRLSPTPQNYNHRVSDSRRIYAAYCKQHETDSYLLPAARAAGWPERIDYFGLCGRIDDEVLPIVQDLLSEFEGSDFFNDAVAGKFKKATAYFGELGYYVIFHTVADKFPAATITSDYARLVWAAVVEQVLVPEAIVALIMTDLTSHTTKQLKSSRPAPTSSNTIIQIPMILLPAAPSDKLLGMGEKLFQLSWADPLPENARHRRTASITMTVDYCERHRFESLHLPKAMAAGWPLHPNFAGLFRRLLDLGKPLRLLCKDITQSVFFLDARQHYKGKTTQLQSVREQYHSTDRLSQQGVGYYGERGYQIFDHTLHFMFPDNFDLADFYSLTYEMIIREVLIPEAAVRIIQADLNLTANAAATVIAESHTFGNVLHPADDDCPFLMKCLRRIAQANQRAQSAARSWQASGTDLSFNNWVQVQKEAWAVQSVKSEPKEAMILKASTSTGEVIDLTLE